MAAADDPEILRAIALREEARQCLLHWTRTKLLAEQVGQEAMRLVVALRRERTLAALRQQGWSVPPSAAPMPARDAEAAPAGLAAMTGAEVPRLAPLTQLSAAATPLPAGALDSDALAVTAIRAASAAVTAATTAATGVIISLLKSAELDPAMLASVAASLGCAAPAPAPAGEDDCARGLAEAWALLQAASHPPVPAVKP